MKRAVISCLTVKENWKPSKAMTLPSRQSA
nr:MAG TPA: hypothetical protein [Caudoviricetes sp.]